ncbi:MAG: recombinase family protein, partial [Oscillospiraceae bacterium]|nr:recombinase family protein [Oscillospiraceae bacterium]
METYCIYLRKSRVDAEAEARGEGETLARHQRTLLELAKRKNLQIVKEYREIVSGDSIASRPQMQAMISDIEAG